MQYKVLKSILVGSTWFYPDEIVDATEDRDWKFIESLGLVEAVIGTAKPKEVKTEPKTKQATITKAGVWYKVHNESGEQIGKPTRDEEEAEFIKLDYETS